MEEISDKKFYVLTSKDEDDRSTDVVADSKEEVKQKMTKLFESGVPLEGAEMVEVDIGGSKWDIYPVITGSESREDSE